MTLLATSTHAHLFGFDLLPGAAVRIAPEALLYCEASIKLQRQWKKGLLTRLGHLLSGQEVFHPVALNTGPQPARLELYGGPHGGGFEVFPQQAFLWNAQAFVCASTELKSSIFFKKRLQQGNFLVLEKSQNSCGIVYLRADHPVVTLDLEEGQSVFVNPQAFLAASFPTRFSLQRVLQSRLLLQVWGPSTLHLAHACSPLISLPRRGFK